MRLLSLGVLIANFFLPSASHAYASQPIIASEWEVAKGVQRVIFPASPTKPVQGLVVVKIRINQTGAVVSAYGPPGIQVNVSDLNSDSQTTDGIVGVSRSSAVVG